MNRADVRFIEVLLLLILSKISTGWVEIAAEVGVIVLLVVQMAETWIRR